MTVIRNLGRATICHLQRAALPFLSWGRGAYFQRHSALAGPKLSECGRACTSLLDIALNAIPPGLDRQARDKISAGLRLEIRLIGHGLPVINVRRISSGEECELIG